jgi:hypothetical protein
LTILQPSDGMPDHRGAMSKSATFGGGQLDLEAGTGACDLARRPVRHGLRQVGEQWKMGL